MQIDPLVRIHYSLYSDMMDFFIDLKYGRFKMCLPELLRRGELPCRLCIVFAASLNQVIFFCCFFISKAAGSLNYLGKRQKMFFFNGQATTALPPPLELSGHIFFRHFFSSFKKGLFFLSGPALVASMSPLVFISDDVL